MPIALDGSEWEILNVQMGALLLFRMEMMGTFFVSFCSCIRLTAVSFRFKRMEVGAEHANEKWTDVLGWSEGEVTIGEDGWAEFGCHGRSVSIWVNKDGRARDEFKQ